MSAEAAARLHNRVARALDRRIPYNNRMRRRSRTAGRVARALVDRRMYPTAPTVRAFWFDDIANFGDQLTPWLLSRAGFMPLHATAESSHLCAVGSILHLLPTDFDGAVWGSGLLKGSPLALPRARWLAVRGRLTQELVGAPGDLPLGDPGLLVSRLFPRPPRGSGLIGVVPHHAQEADPRWARLASRYPDRVRVINVRRGPAVVTKEISSCGAILTTSLHGLVTADAYGIPAAWAEGDPPLTGGDFKFRDYASGLRAGLRKVDLDDVGDPDSILRSTATVDPWTVRDRQDGLLAALQRLEVERVSLPRLVAGLVSDVAGVS